jgi:hypothetical protein
MSDNPRPLAWYCPKQPAAVNLKKVQDRFQGAFDFPIEPLRRNLHKPGRKV